MIMRRWVLLTLTVFLLAACSNASVAAGPTGSTGTGTGTTGNTGTAAPTATTSPPTSQGLGVSMAQAQADFGTWNQTGVGFVWAPPSASGGPEVLIGLVVEHGIRIDLYGPSQSNLSEVMASFTGGSGADAANAGIIMLGEAQRYGGNEAVTWLTGLLNQADNNGASSTFANIVQEQDFGSNHLAFSSDPSGQLALDVTLTSCSCAAF